MIPKSSLQSQAYDTIKELILTNSLDSNKLYSETQLAKNMGISRTPLREALQCLSQDGYITIIPSRGFKVRKLNKKNAKMIIEARCAIEGFCIHSIIADKDNIRYEKLINNLEETIETMKKHLNSEDLINEFSEADHRFHLLIVHYLGNTEFNSMYQRLMYMIHLTTSQVLSVDGRPESTLAEHETILKYIKENQGDNAYQALLNHLMMPLNFKFVEEDEEIEPEDLI
ncbi:MAG: GntR family transcriptional regulator [Eubacteriales bacterium]|nr:GntR family transcriptional regulator [Eubacteriales bacterium]